MMGAAERLDDGNASAIGRSELVEGFEQFEGNIPEFISYFLDSAGPGRRSGRRMRMRRARGGGGGGGGERGEKRARRPRGPRGAGGTLAEKVAAEEKQTVGKVERRFPLREGRSVHVMWRGVGGGRVGTWLHLPPRKRCRARAYARQNSAQSQGKADNCQEKTPAIRKARGRPPRIQSLPVHAHSSLHETDAVYEVLAHGPLTPTMLPTLPLPPAQSRYYLDQLLLDLNQPSGAGGEQLEDTRCSHTPMPTDTTSPSMPCSVGKAEDVCPVEEGERGNRAKVHGEAEVVDSLKCLLMTLDESLDVKSSFTGVKDPQEGPPHSTESFENLPQQGGSEPPLSKARRGSRIPKASRLYRRSKGKRPVFRSGCKPFTWKSEVKGKDKDKKKAPSPKEQQESVLKEEMFEERRMTRNQAKRISETPSADPAPAPGEKGQQNDASENLPELPEQQQQQQQGEEEKQEKEQEKVALCKTLPRASGKNMSSLLRHCGEKEQQDDASENLIEHPERQQQQQQEEEEKQEREQEKVALCKTQPRASGKNMSLLRQKLLGKKRKGEEAAAAEESPSRSAAEAPPSPSPSPRKRPRRLVALQSPSAIATQGRE
ncbi:nucleolar and coiled-body phosphoprotein 1-like isoform X2 [Engraulis encrasicolus]|uniref:nucleolar and coiled-body phosphoprotein 1-like isoform X2 n=1 Tax=Engraulis encrasicolus TaxID=184585 RepID=UPI002FCFF6C8